VPTKSFVDSDQQNYKQRVRQDKLRNSSNKRKLTPILGDLIRIHSQLQVESIIFSNEGDVEAQLQNWASGTDPYQDNIIQRSNYFKRIAQLFTINRNARATLASAVVMASQQMSGKSSDFAFVTLLRQSIPTCDRSYVKHIFNTCTSLANAMQLGINIFAFLSASFFADNAHGNGFSAIRSLWLSFGFAAANSVFSPIAYWFIDNPGRRFLLLASLIAMFPLLLATGFSFSITNEASRTGAICLWLCLYTAAYSPGGGVSYLLFPVLLIRALSHDGGRGERELVQLSLLTVL
jgi:hypothetical protein